MMKRTFPFLLWFLYWVLGAVSGVADMTPNAAARTDPPQPALSEGALAALRGLAKLGNKPIEFYGQIVDQEGKAISGAKVTLQIRLMKEPEPGIIGEGFDEVSTTSDAEGRFTLTKVNGSVLTIKSLAKEGYQPSSKATNRSFRYWDNEAVRFKPDATRPEIFKMWKKAGTESLVRLNKFYGIVPDGRTYAIDVVKGEKVEGGTSGDFKVSIQRPAKIAGDEKYDWSCTVEGIDGGIMQSDDEQMYLAPGTGYLQKFEIKLFASSSNWSDREKRQFYIKSRDGNVYARLAVEIFANYRDEAVFSVESYANPRGSRNLEYDPMQGVAR